MKSPTRTAREYPTLGSHGVPDEMFWRLLKCALPASMLPARRKAAAANDMSGSASVTSKDVSMRVQASDARTEILFFPVLPGRRERPSEWPHPQPHQIAT